MVIPGEVTGAALHQRFALAERTSAPSEEAFVKMFVDMFASAERRSMLEVSTHRIKVFVEISVKMFVQLS